MLAWAHGVYRPIVQVNKHSFKRRVISSYTKPPKEKATLVGRLLYTMLIKPQNDELSCASPSVYKQWNSS